MHISEQIAAALIAARFTARPIKDGIEYSARIAGAAEPGTVCPDGARIIRITLDASGRWLASVDGWGNVLVDCDLRLHLDAGQALQHITGQAWPAIRARLVDARAESCQQNDGTYIHA